MSIALSSLFYKFLKRMKLSLCSISRSISYTARNKECVEQVHNSTNLYPTLAAGSREKGKSYNLIKP